MKTLDVMENLVFGEEGPYAQQLISDEIGKIVRYTLKQGQELDETHAPFLPRYFVVVKGEAVFTSETGEEKRCGEGCLVRFGPREENSIQAVTEEVVVVGFLHWATAG
jgi:quercetin dioxygenase-like cupin family protein